MLGAPEQSLPAGRRNAVGELLPVALVVAACVVLFLRAATLQGVFFHYDHSVQNYPFRLFFVRALREGRFPLWTSDIFCGFPLFAESQSNALYPPFLILFMLLKPWVAYNYYHLLHFVWAGVGAYVLARVLRVGRAGAALAGICYMLSGPVLYHAHHTNILVGVSWLPWLLVLIELACSRRTLGPVLGFAASAGLLALGAQPQYTLYCGLACGIYLVWRLDLIERVAGGFRRAAPLGMALGLAGLLGMLLAAAQLLPLAELVSHSSRGRFELPGLSLCEPGNVMTLMLPYYFGSPGQGSYWGNIGPGVYSELTLFVGTAPLLLAILGAVADRTRRALFLAGLGLFSLIFSLGFGGSIYNMFALLPVFSASRFPSRFAFVGALCVALLAGIGLDRLRERPPDARTRRAAAVAVAVVAALAAVALAVALANFVWLMPLSRAKLAQMVPWRCGFDVEAIRLHLHEAFPQDALRLVAALVAAAALALGGVRRRFSPRAAAALWVALVFVELACIGQEFTAVTDPRIYEEPPQLARVLRKLPPGRVFHYAYVEPFVGGVRFGLYPYIAGWSRVPGLYAESLARLPPNSNMIFGVPCVSGFSPLQTEAFKTLMGSPHIQATIIPFALTPALRVLNARYVVTPLPELPAPLRLVGQAGGVHIFENPLAMPRAFIVHRTRFARDFVAVQHLRERDFDSRSTAFVHSRSAPRLDLGPQPDESAEIVSDTGDAVLIRCRLGAPGLLVLADEYYPGWRVHVDGREGRIYRVDYLLKGVALGPGEHDVRFTFRPASFRNGVELTVLGLALLAIGLGLWVTRRPRVPFAGAAEAESPLLAPYSDKSRRMVLLLGAIFLALGPLARPQLWRKLPHQLSPVTHMAPEPGDEGPNSGPRPWP